MKFCLILGILIFDVSSGYSQNCADPFIQAGMRNEREKNSLLRLRIIQLHLNVIQTRRLAYLDRGVAEHELGEFLEAVKDYTKAISLKPRDAVAYFDRALAYDALHLYDKSLSDYNSGDSICVRSIERQFGIEGIVKRRCMIMRVQL